MNVTRDLSVLLQNLLPEHSRLPRLRLGPVRLGEVVHARERGRMIVTQDHFSLRQHFLVHLCGLCRFSLLSVRLGEVVHARERGRMIVAQDHPAFRQLLPPASLRPLSFFLAVDMSRRGCACS